MIELDTIHTEQHGPILLVRITKASDHDAGHGTTEPSIMRRFA